MLVALVQGLVIPATTTAETLQNIMAVVVAVLRMARKEATQARLLVVWVQQAPLDLLVRTLVRVAAPVTVVAVVAVPVLFIIGTQHLIPAVIILLLAASLVMAPLVVLVLLVQL